MNKEENHVYEKMWNTLKNGLKNNKFFYSVICEDTPIRHIKDFIKDLERKYFPEVKK